MACFGIIEKHDWTIRSSGCLKPRGHLPRLLRRDACIGVATLEQNCGVLGSRSNAFIGRICLEELELLREGSIAVFEQSGWVIVFGVLVIANHIQIRMPAHYCLIEVWALDQRCSDQQAAVAATPDGQFAWTCIFFGNQPFCRGYEVIEDILLFFQ